MCVTWFDDGGTQFRSAVDALTMSTPTPHASEHAHALFREFDVERHGRISTHKYVRFVTREALARTAAQVIDFFRPSEADDMGAVSKDGFRRALTHLSFSMPHDLVDEIFDEMDAVCALARRTREADPAVREPYVWGEAYPSGELARECLRRAGKAHLYVCARARVHMTPST